MRGERWEKGERESGGEKETERKRVRAVEGAYLMRIPQRAAATVVVVGGIGLHEEAVWGSGRVDKSENMKVKNKDSPKTS